MGDGIQERKGIQIRKLTSCRRNHYIVYIKHTFLSFLQQIYILANRKN